MLNTHFCDNPYLLIDYNCLLTIKMYSVPNSPMRLNLLCRSLFLSLLSKNNMFIISIITNRGGDAASKWFKACCTHELPSLDLTDDSSIVNGKYLPIATNYQEISVMTTGPSFQAYNAKNTPCNHWRRLTLSAEFIFWDLLK